ncbi:ubinuclein-1-like isoform X2 [Phragmites australis]|uniref:ubinuclein-1-like isoform X2 n=1 Tax=Phragmites australis TaxID=29695 RepID=UPI002D7A2D02|nr:ubinuclein-1-like isoform X2 [Phragmites australis]
MEDPVAASSAPGPATAAAAARIPAEAAAAPPALAPQQPPATATATAAVPEAAATCRRQVFSVELRPGETTIVSWKKLLREAGHAAAAPAVTAEPALAAHAGPSDAAHPAENDPKDPTQPNRFNAVIEKIERLYMGKHSSDEEDLDDVPDDDQYDTEDSFIDDAELDEYFEVDNLTTKHDGYFVNKGKLEQIDPGTSTNVTPKKRRRKDSSNTYLENNQLAPGDYFSIGDVPGKSSGRGAAQMGKQLASSNVGSYLQYHEDNRVVKNKTGASGGAPKRKSSDFAVVADAAARTKMSSKDVSHAPLELRDLEKHKAAALQSIDHAHKSKTSETYDYTYSAYKDKGTSMQLDFQQRKAIGENQDPSNRMHRKENHGISEYPGMAMANAVYSTQTVHPIIGREGSGTKPKGTRLERAIRDLQKIVADYRSPTIDINEVDPNGQAAVKRRLPQEVKQKLAKVARLSANQGKIQEHELMDRLMGIVGHLVQRRTLKRNMKEMVESGLSAKLEKADRFQRVKMEINEMVKARVAAKSKVNEQQDGSADDFQVTNDGRRALKGKSVMDTALEDRICDLYDLYVEGMDEDKGPQSRKLYVELADLWPQGYMDNVGIKDAIYRSKERKRLLYSQQKVRNEERMKRKRLAAAAKLQDGYPVVMQGAHVPQVAQPSATNPITYPAPAYGQNQGSKSSERVREISSSAIPDDSNRNSGEMKKKKRKPESDFVDTQANLLKAPLQKPFKPSDEVNAGSLPSAATTATVLGLPTVLGHDQQSS